jgi:aldehyde dehydrogenase (NAD+)
MIPQQVENYINGKEVAPRRQQYFDKLNPHDGTLLSLVARSDAIDIDDAVRAATGAALAWRHMPPVKRGEILFAICRRLQDHQTDVAQIVALETGKSQKEAIAETAGAISLGLFMAGEGARLYGKTTTSAMPNKYPAIIREPVGTAGLIIAFNTPIANVAWKVFPALICGNTTVLKSSEDTPLTAQIFAKLAHESGLPPGVLNVVHGFGQEAGDPLVRHRDVNLISFTGSTEVGRSIGQVAAGRLAKVFLELGGKNPMVVCDDADLTNAVHWAALSAFSNAGQRCAACSRLIVFEDVYDDFVARLVEKTKSLRVGPADTDDFGPVINAQQLANMLACVERAVKQGARILFGGHRIEDIEHRNGFYMLPTILEGVEPDDEISVTELFGPIVCLYKVKNFEQALTLSNHSPYGLTACIHTRNINRANVFVRNVQAGVAVVNAGTYGSEPNMPFGGVKQSGNGWREPGTEALDVYSNVKNIVTVVNDTDL